MSTVPLGWSFPVRATGRARELAGLCFKCRQRLYSRAIIKEDDVVLLRKKGDEKTNPILTKPLRHMAKIKVPRGTIEADNLIGKGVRDLVSSSKGMQYRIRQPSLAEYVTLSPRIVTPVYPADANLIVSLLDLHPPAISTSLGTDGPLEIFEAGTGHGALTLHLARAIHGLNPPAPPPPPINVIQDALSGGASPEDLDVLSSSQPSLSTEDLNKDAAHVALKEKYEAYLPTRRAIVHTLDISPTYSQYAQKIVRNFRHGIYYPDIDFHTGTIPEYLSSRLASHPDPFLSHAILDLPSPHSFMELVGQALKLDGFMIVFSPSITQITTCIQLVREKNLPLALDTVLELGAGTGVGGREWDVRSVKPRALLRAEAEARTARNLAEGENAMVNESTDIVNSLPGESNDAQPSERSDKLPGESKDSQPEERSDAPPDETTEAQSTGWEMVCRPKVGPRVTGGGFLGVWCCVRK